MADTANAHPTDGRRRKEKGPPSKRALPRLERVSDTEREHSEDSAGEKKQSDRDLIQGLQYLLHVVCPMTTML